MMNAPFPVVSPMNWSRLLLLIFTISFALCSLTSIILIDDQSINQSINQSIYQFSPRLHHIHVAHSVIPISTTQSPNQHQKHSFNHPHHPSHTGDEDGDYPDDDIDLSNEHLDDHLFEQSALNISLASIIFRFVAPYEQQIEEMEQLVHQSVHQVNKSTPNNQTVYQPHDIIESDHHPITQPITLNDLTSQSKTYLSLVDQTVDSSNKQSVYQSIPQSIKWSDNLIFSLIVIDQANTQSIKRLTRPAASFFLPQSIVQSIDQSRILIDGDWSVDWEYAIDVQSTDPLIEHSNSRSSYQTISCSAVSLDHRCVAIGVIEPVLESEGLDFNIALKIIQTIKQPNKSSNSQLTDESDVGWNIQSASQVHPLHIPLFGHQKVTSISISQPNEQSLINQYVDQSIDQLIVVSYARENDERTFRTILLSVSEQSGMLELIHRSDHEILDRPISGPHRPSGNHSNKQTINRRPVVDRLLPFRLLPMIQPPVTQSTNQSTKSISQATNKLGLQGTDHVIVLEHFDPSINQAANHLPPSIYSLRQPLYQSADNTNHVDEQTMNESTDSWCHFETLAPYRQSNTPNNHVKHLYGLQRRDQSSQPLNNQLIIHQSMNQLFTVISRVPYITIIDQSINQVSQSINQSTNQSILQSIDVSPIEIIHLPESTRFELVAIDQFGLIVCLIDHRGDVIVLHRAFQITEIDHSNDRSEQLIDQAIDSLVDDDSPITFQSDNHTTSQPEDHSELNEQSNKQSNNQSSYQYKVEKGTWNVELELSLPVQLRRLQILAIELVDIDNTNKQSNNQSINQHSVDDSRTYLVALFESGVIATFDLALTKKRLPSQSVTQSINQSLNQSIHQSINLVEFLNANPELLIGLIIVFGSAITSLLCARTAHGRAG